MLTIQGNALSPAGMVWLGILFSFYSFMMAAGTIAVSSELFALSPAKTRILSIALCVSLQAAGVGISRFSSGWILDSGMLADQWTFAGWSLTSFHTLFLFFGVFVIMTCVLLTLVPSVMAKVQRLPAN